MKKKLKYLFILIILTFFNVTPVNADNCAQIDNKITMYNNYTEVLEGLDCTDNSDSQNVAICNSYNTNRNLIVTYLMKANDNGDICKNQQASVEKIIDENSDRCGKIFNDDFQDLVNRVMVIFYILGPILLILFGSLDYTKAVVSSEADAMKKANKNFVKRLSATILLFLSPVIVNIIIGFNTTDYYLSGNAYSCNYKYLVYNKKYNIKYVTTPKRSSNLKPGQYNGDILSAALQMHSVMENEKWTYSIGGDLFWNNIESSTNNPNKVSCCATYVGSTLYIAGVFSEKEMNSYNYNSAPGTYTFLNEQGWTKITNYDDLQPGDIVFTGSDSSIGHVQIYAGNDTWYNAGSTKAIQRINPYSQGDWARGEFIAAMRY